jgi:hypothetical protein
LAIKITGNALDVCVTYNYSLWVDPGSIVTYKSEDQFQITAKKRYLAKAREEIKIRTTPKSDPISEPTPIVPDTKPTRSKKPPKEVRKPEKKISDKRDSARINRPRLGEIPEIENKRVSCGLKSGRIQGNQIRCDCCSKEFSVGHFEIHAGRAAGLNLW